MSENAKRDQQNCDININHNEYLKLIKNPLMGVRQCVDTDSPALHGIPQQPSRIPISGVA